MRRGGCEETLHLDLLPPPPWPRGAAPASTAPDDLVRDLRADGVALAGVHNAPPGSMSDDITGFCDRHRPSPSRVSAGCWGCSREEETGKLEESRREVARLGVVRDRLAIAVSVTRAALEDMITNTGGHRHWDPKGTSGANCETCIRQRDARERARVALTLEPVHSLKGLDPDFDAGAEDHWYGQRGEHEHACGCGALWTHLFPEATTCRDDRVSTCGACLDRGDPA